jgi:hypothetical protein
MPHKEETEFITKDIFINIANNPVQHDQTKLVDRQRLLSRRNLSGQIADCLTKDLGLFLNNDRSSASQLRQTKFMYKKGNQCKRGANIGHTKG